jgi:hypothetical protein
MKIARQVLSMLAFGVFVGIMSLLGSPRYEGGVRLVLSIIAGAALMVAVQTFTAGQRSKGQS